MPTDLSSLRDTTWSASLHILGSSPGKCEIFTFDRLIWQHILALFRAVKSDYRVHQVPQRMPSIVLDITLTGSPQLHVEELQRQTNQSTLTHHLLLVISTCRTHT